MRRSAAPSYKHVMPGSNTANGVCAKLVREPFPKAPRSTASILKLIEDGVEDGKQKSNPLQTDANACNNNIQTELLNQRIAAEKQRVLSEHCKNVQANAADSTSSSSSLPSSSSGIKIFNVVWGKQSTKKHKTWEGDGTLEVGEKGIVLKDPEGKVLGRGTHKKSVPIEEGSRLFVGSKEVEIIDVATEEITPVSANTNVNEKRTADTDLYRRHNPVKKTKLIPAFSVPVKGHSRHGNVVNYEPLVMPQPPPEHQVP